MHRSSRQRIWKIEKRLSPAQKQRGERRQLLEGTDPFHARLHATAVAAIVLSGQPRIDEALACAWLRALQHYKINERLVFDALEGAKQLLPIIIDGANESAIFTEIFRTGPPWLLNFTKMFIDAFLLEFDLPDISERSRWGSVGYEEARGWPSLPFGKMTEGDPVTDEDARLYPLPLGISDFVDNLLREDEDNLSSEDLDHDPSPEDLIHFLDLVEVPESEWSRFERRRMFGTAKFLFRLKKGQ
jgi:hypothetical protein